MAKPGAGRVYLDVPYREKDAAKANGARWDSHARRWYDPRPHTPALQRWAARPDVPEVLAGEDRSFGQGLFVDLVPASCWFTNVRSCVTDADWERLRRPILRRADHRCEACGNAEDRATARGLEVHERWHYDYDRNVQSLRRLIALCPACHTTTHLGYAAVTGRDREAIAHLQAVAGMTDSQAREHITTAYEVWAVRSVIEWELDLSILTVAGVQLRPPPTATERPEIAEQRLAGARAEDATAASGADADVAQREQALAVEEGTSTCIGASAASGEHRRRTAHPTSGGQASGLSSHSPSTVMAPKLNYRIRLFLQSTPS